MKYKKIALIGMMGSGKSSTAKVLAEKLNFELQELDEIFEKEENISIANFFKKNGEENFRTKETQILKNALKKDNTVISCGGGIIIKKENRNLLFKDDILTIYLKADKNTILKRIKNDTTRPLLNTKNQLEAIEEILSKREIFYRQAKYTIETDNKSIEEIIKEIEKINE